MLKYTEPLDLVFQALADPSRRAMLERLSHGEASVSELARPFSMSLPAVVQHLHVLEESGLVASEKRGRVRICHIETAGWEHAASWIEHRRSEWEARFDRLAAYFKVPSDNPTRRTP